MSAEGRPLGAVHGPAAPRRAISHHETNLSADRYGLEGRARCRQKSRRSLDEREFEYRVTGAGRRGSTRWAPPVASGSTLTPGASFGGHPRPAAAAAESPRTRSRSPPGAGRQALTMDKDRGGFDPAVHGPALPVST